MCVVDVCVGFSLGLYENGKREGGARSMLEV